MGRPWCPKWVQAEKVYTCGLSRPLFSDYALNLFSVGNLEKQLRFFPVFEAVPSAVFYSFLVDVGMFSTFVAVAGK